MKSSKAQQAAAKSEQRTRMILAIGGTAAAAFLAAFLVYGPALRGGFLLDDRYLPIFDPNITADFSRWVGLIRPMLGVSYWLDYLVHGSDPYGFHITNVVLHVLVSALAGLIAAKLLEWSGVKGRARNVLAMFAGALFLLHPLQTESVSYLASRSETLSVLFYYAAFAVFLCRSGETMSLPRSIAVMTLFALALATKEHTLTLAILIVFADFYWNRGGFRAHKILYSLLAVAGLAGAAFIYRIVSTTNTAGLSMQDLTPRMYFFTQCRVVWTYIRMFFVPAGQNLDPDIPVSSGFDTAAIAGLAAFVGLAAAAWIYRKRFPLASFGLFTFLLLIAPTSSIIPIRDVMAERRMYLPMIGLILVALEFLRRMKTTQVVWAGAAALAVCAFATYQRNLLWGTPLDLWRDAAAKSPNKYRPRFQVAYALYEAGSCKEAAESYEKASKLGPIDARLLVDWALALDCAGKWREAIDQLQRSLAFENSAHIHTQIAMVYAKNGGAPEAMEELEIAERLNPSYEMIYVYRGNIYEVQNNRDLARREYTHALQINPQNQAARDALARVGR
jgi:tetratricopeptide (TPR) repeat protein